jgi:hypothetical protein
MLDRGERKGLIPIAKRHNDYEKYGDFIEI